GNECPSAGSNPPNDWTAWFGGSAWTYDETSGQYYLGIFSPHQPDLNWENPVLRGEIYKMMRWWLDKGIDGFRMDAISLISKPNDFPDGNIKKIVPNGQRVHEFLREMRREALCHYDIMTVGETGGITADDAVEYANAESSELNMVFQFETVELDGGETFKWNDRKIVITELKEVLSRWQNKLYGRAWNSLYWCNHDQPRIVSRFGGGDTLREKPSREKLAKMLAVCLHFMQGTPYIYQGEELGMTNAPFADIGDYRDLESINAYYALVPEKIAKEDMLRYMRLKSRDNSRTPMQWNQEYNAGFSSAPENKLWIMLNPNYLEINAQEQTQRGDSVFNFYRTLVELRKTMDIITCGSYELLLPGDPDLFVYTRACENEELLVICNFAREQRVYRLPERFYGARTVIANEDVKPGKELVLGSFGAVVFLQESSQE
ncbi:MAG: alpha-glucosidase C-terminal domain-containing protein, partial [Treponema sp.]|nr:alpha-glucosidase C-terminal domain-containing protein [Treponema sp.]